MDLLPKTPPEAERFLKKVRAFVSALRGRKDVALFLVGGLLLTAGGTIGRFQSLLGSAVGALQPALIVAGLLSLVSGFVLVFRQAVPEKIEPLPSKPAPIVGTAPFGTVHAEIFARLGRQTEIDVLLAYVMDDKFPLVVVLGPAGVGKTSLVTAGLTHALKGHGRSLVYWSANASEAGSLFEIIRDQWVSNSGPPKRIEDLVERRRTEPHVIVLDQMERLSPSVHGEVFELIKRLASAPLPSMLTLVVVLQQERLLDWFKFQSELPPERIRHLPLSPFSRREAEDVLVTLLDTIHLTIDRSDLRTIVADIATGEEVLPADVGVVFLMLSDVLQSGHITSDQLRTMGGGTGLRSAYVRRQLSLLPKPLQGEVLRALVALVDTRALQPLAEGLRQDELVLVSAVKPASESDFLNALDTLAIPFARLLVREETVEGEPRYRLLHGLVRAVLHVADVRFVPAAEVLEAAYEVHRARPDYLLPWRGLRTVLAALKERSLVVTDPGKIEYIERSRHYWRVRLGRQFAVAVAFAALLVGGYRYLDQRNERQLFESWGLPADVGSQPLKALSLGKSVTRLDWLPGDLERLRLERSRIRSLQGLPRGLKRLEVSDTNLEELGELPRGLRHLTVAANHLRSLQGAPSSLHSLSMAEEGVDPEELYRFRSLTALAVARSRKVDLARLPDSLKLLSLTRAGVDGLAGLPARLTTLKLVGTSVRSLQGLPDLEALSLVKGDVPVRLEGLPGSLRRLELDDQAIEGRLILPPGLVGLVIKKKEGACFAQDTVFPVTLTELSLYGCEYDPTRLPKTLTSLSLDARSVGALDSLPRSLRSVRLDWFPGQDLLGLPPGLESVAVTFAANLRSLRGLPASVRVLDLSGCSSLADLSPLPKKLETMAFRWSRLKRVPALPETLLALDLLGSDRLEDLPKLTAALQTLNIAGTKIRDSRYIPGGISALHLSPDQLRRLPGQVKLQELHIVEDPIASGKRGEQP